MKKQKSDHKLLIRLREEQYRKLRKEAHYNFRSVADIIREAVDNRYAQFRDNKQ